MNESVGKQHLLVYQIYTIGMLFFLLFFLSTYWYHFCRYRYT